ncbi:MAG: hypothetical protein ACOC7L_01995, partial [Acidobacteriota bacterium]
GVEILLVDDDNDDPDNRPAYGSALDELGALYDVWNTLGTDDEPSATELAEYTTVLWFTGDLFGGTAGPGAASEGALATWLDAGGCLFVSSQNYAWDRGVTSFMQDYLGVSSLTHDVFQTSVEGAGSLFDGLGPFALSYPPSLFNMSDEIDPDGTAEVAFTGDKGNAAVDKETSSYRTAFLGFPLEAVPSVTDRADVLAGFVDGCVGCGASDNLTVTDRFVDSTATVEACSSVTLGSGVHVDASGDLTVRAGDRVVLENGVSIGAGGKLTVETGSVSPAN